ncbi:MAG: CaiB/BaiF CoA transferase family protein [Ilumatobacteraceae bacterium]
MARPLAAVRVLDASGFISGPLAATMLADLGADVIKVEPESGDRLARWGRVVDGRGIVYTNCNRGKGVVTLDLKSDAARAKFFDLAGDADVLITNWRSGVAERLGLAEPLAGLPSLVWVRITGWGPDGPLADQPAFDGSLQARTGLAWSQGDEEPNLMRMFIADKITAMFAVQAIAAALYERHSTGSGGIIEVPMLDALAYFNFADLLQNRTLLSDPPASARNEQIEANRPVRTLDGWIVISPVGGRQLKATLEAVGRPEAIADLRASTSQHDLTTRLVELCSRACASRTTAEWLATFDQYDVPAAPVLDIDGHLADPQVAHNRIYDIVNDPLLGDIRRARYPAYFGDDDPRGTATAVHRLAADEIAWPERAATASGLRRS